MTDQKTKPEDYTESNTSQADLSEITSESSELPFQQTQSMHHFHHILDDAAFEQKLSEEKIMAVTRQYHVTSDPKEKKTLSPVLIIFLAIVLGLTSGAGYRLMDFILWNKEPEATIKYIPEFSQHTEDMITNSLSVSSIAEQLEPSVVAITNESVQESFFGETVGTSSGSGVIFNISTKYIYILTNNHVIENASNLNVNFTGDKTYAADIVGSDADTDLAVITVQKDKMLPEDFERIRPVTLGDSANLSVGEQAIAIGNPLGYTNTVTVGVISALDRIISDDLNALSLIQTDAAINPGNSGGALVNARGELIGINTIKISDTAVEGIGFAIPINSALPVLEEIIAKGYVSKPFMGIFGRDVTEDLAKMYDIPMGVFVSDIIPSGPASHSDLKAYDIITAIDGQPVLTMFDLNRIIAGYTIGDSITVTVQRETDDVFKTLEIEITIGDRHDY